MARLALLYPHHWAQLDPSHHTEAPLRDFAQTSLQPWGQGNRAGPHLPVARIPTKLAIHSTVPYRTVVHSPSPHKLLLSHPQRPSLIPCWPIVAVGHTLEFRLAGRRCLHTLPSSIFIHRQKSTSPILRNHRETNFPLPEVHALTVALPSDTRNDDQGGS